MTTPKTVCFVGAGNMASAMLRGLAKSPDGAPKLRAADIDQERLDALQELGLPIETFTETKEAVRDCDLVVLAVKPQIIKPVARTIASDLGIATAVLSIAAGTTINSLQSAAQTSQVMRAMPNTPALLGLGVTALYAPSDIRDDLVALAENVLSGCGAVFNVATEAMIDAATAISGSGPAYFFEVMRAMTDAAERLGFDPQTSRALVTQTAAGAAAVAITESATFDTLLSNVTSPGGTTAAARKVFSDAELHAIFDRAIQAALERGQNLGQLQDK